MGYESNASPKFKREFTKQIEADNDSEQFYFGKGRIIDVLIGA